MTPPVDTYSIACVRGMFLLPPGTKRGGRPRSRGSRACTVVERFSSSHALDTCLVARPALLRPAPTVLLLCSNVILPQSLLFVASERTLHASNRRHVRRPRRRPALRALRVCVRMHPGSVRDVCTDRNIVIRDDVAVLCLFACLPVFEKRKRCTGRTSSRRASTWMSAPGRRWRWWVPREAESPPAYSFSSGELLPLPPLSAAMAVVMSVLLRVRALGHPLRWVWRRSMDGTYLVSRERPGATAYLPCRGHFDVSD